MMKMRSNPTGMFSPARGRTVAGGGSPEGATFWEMRPRGMLVQKRNSDSEHSSIHIPTIKVKIKYGSSYFEFSISSQASFGELKKMVAGATGVHQEDQKLIFKEKVRESKTLLDAVGVNNGSIIVLIEEKQNLEFPRNTKMDNASKEIAEINMAVDKFAMQVANLETQICGGERVVEKVLLNLIEQLMTQLIKLDGIVADGDIKLKRKLQVKRVQKYIETLDMLKMRNSMIGSGSRVVPLQQYNQQETNGKMQTNTRRNLKEQQKKNNHSTGKMMQPVMVTTNWVTLDNVVSKKLPFSSSASAIKYGNYNVSSKRNLEYFV